MMRTRRGRRTAWPLAVAWAFAGALAVSLAQPSAAAAQSECGDYISGGRDFPASGTLLGTQRVTLTFGGNAGVGGGGLSGGINGSIAVSFNVGIYRMHDGSHRSLRCDDYTDWDLQ
ncbi:MAG: hypothetical protein F4Z33_10655 [Gemmatimonadales bacterium]|nr:hypothetical protein [Gemmatimonadales bacterium]MXX79375.1 hypothetical protein [Gemmatimonadales bacterium]MYC89013.1 hypothetical protein [Candidatus Palauibacter denitrificans]